MTRSGNPLLVALGADTSGLRRGLRRGQGDLQSFARSGASSLNVLGSAGGRAAGGLSRATAALGGLTAAGGAVALVAGLALGLNGAAKSAAKLETALAEVSTIADKSTFPVEELRANSAQLAATYGGTQVAQVKAFYQAISAGARDSGDATALLHEANKLAVGGLTDVESSIKVLSQTMNAYGRDAVSAREVSDTLFTTVRLGITRVEDLAASIGDVTPLAAKFGVSIQEVGASIGTLTKINADAAKSTTQLRAILTAVAKGSAKSQKAAKALGIEFTTTALRTKGLLKFLQDIADTQPTDQQLAQLFGRVEALSGVMALTAEGSKELKAQLVAQAQAAGASGAAFDTMANTTEQSFARMQGAVDGLLNKLGELSRFNPLKTELYKRTASLAEKLTRALDARMRDDFEGMVRALKGINIEALPEETKRKNEERSDEATAKAAADALLKRNSALAEGIRKQAAAMVELSKAAGLSNDPVKRSAALLREAVTAQSQLRAQVAQTAAALDPTRKDFELTARAAKAQLGALKEQDGVVRRLRAQHEALVKAAKARKKEEKRIAKIQADLLRAKAGAAARDVAAPARRMTSRLEREIEDAEKLDQLLSDDPWTQFIKQSENAGKALKTSLVDGVQAFASGLGDVTGRAIFFSDSLAEGFGNLAKSIGSDLVSSLVRIGVQMGVTHAIGESLAKTSLATAAASIGAATAASAAAAQVVSTAWGPAAIAASVGTFGAAAGIGAGAYLTALSAGTAATHAAQAVTGLTGALSGAFGGIAHGGLDRVPKTGTFLLERGERVINANQNADLTRALANGGLGGGVTINNYAPGLDIEAVDRDGVTEVIIRRAVDGARALAARDFAAGVESGRGPYGETLRRAYGRRRY